MILDYRELFDYVKKQRARLIEALEKIPNEEFVRDRGLSFGSVKDVLAHTVMVEDNWLHYRAAGIAAGTSLTLEGFKELEHVKRYAAEVDSKTERLFNKMTESDLQREVKRTTRDGREEVFSLEQILYHLPIEVIYHFGEIFGEFWKMNTDAPYCSYLAYSIAKAGT